MKNWIRSCMIAFSMYSKLPVPQFEWKEENMRYAMIFFPWVGIVTGGLELLWFAVASRLGIPSGFYAAVATVLPIVVTGGIHADGYIDTIDARASHQGKERRLEILKDPHTGAFAIIWAIVYFLLYHGAYQVVSSYKSCLMIAVCYVASRAFSGLAAVTFPAAKKTGTLAVFSHAADRKLVRAVLIFYVLAAGSIELALWWESGLVLIFCGGLFFAYYYRMAKKEFGGITGDLEGWFLQCFELLMLLIVVLVELASK